ncbi:N-acetylornithine carbamoyltransferase [Labilithrix luteola]|uniref:N-acetylornithine carbamoyltransferase n=1 Tax=Labilithrix luteola TaxID=1391654 RepID=A0A0K1Q1B7_9BACT|nr:N-acetylornithine carbamoyltransferase [Labilithrix luteola]AKU99199.1 N-acetylornithine carbamoyltransferase [Labilithrix luteola]
MTTSTAQTTPPRHFLSTLDWSRSELESLLTDARELKANRRTIARQDLAGKSVALVFFNPSLRTRSSFEIGVFEMGGHAVVLEPGKGAWPIEYRDGVVMDAEAEEHVEEVARVLSRYCDIIAVRAFPKFQRWEDDREDLVIRQFAKYATVPVLNMETITHPCQELALMLALKEKLGTTDGKKFLLTWTYHPRPLNTAVANSALIAAAKFGFDVTLLCPTPEYVLDSRYMDAAKNFAAEQGRSITVTHDVDAAYAGANVVYAKSWGALPYFGRWEEEKPIRDAHKHFIVDERKMALTDNGYFSHCLPMRRNVKATDAVTSGPRSLVIEEAENRLHVQKALLRRLVGLGGVSP